MLAQWNNHAPQHNLDKKNIHIKNEPANTTHIYIHNVLNIGFKFLKDDAKYDSTFEVYIWMSRVRSGFWLVFPEGST